MLGNANYWVEWAYELFLHYRGDSILSILNSVHDHTYRFCESPMACKVRIINNTGIGNTSFSQIERSCLPHWSSMPCTATTRVRHPSIVWPESKSTTTTGRPDPHEFTCLQPEDLAASTHTPSAPRPSRTALYSSWRRSHYVLVGDQTRLILSYHPPLSLRQRRYSSYPSPHDARHRHQMHYGAFRSVGTGRAFESRRGSDGSCSFWRGRRWQVHWRP